MPLQTASARYSWETVRVDRVGSQIDDVPSPRLLTATARIARESSQNRSKHSQQHGSLRGVQCTSSRSIKSSASSGDQHARGAHSERSKSMDFDEASFLNLLERYEMVTREMLKFLNSSPSTSPTQGATRRQMASSTRQRRGNSRSSHSHGSSSSSSSRRRRVSNSASNCPAPRMPKVASVPALSCLDSPSPSSTTRPRRSARDSQQRRQRHLQPTLIAGSLTPPPMPVLARQQDAFAAGEALCKQLETTWRVPEEALWERRTGKSHSGFDLRSRSFTISCRKQGPADGKSTPALPEPPPSRLHHLTASECCT